MWIVYSRCDPQPNLNAQLAKSVVIQWCEELCSQPSHSMGQGGGWAFRAGSPAYLDGRCVNTITFPAYKGAHVQNSPTWWYKRINEAKNVLIPDNGLLSRISKTRGYAAYSPRSLTHAAAHVFSAHVVHVLNVFG